MRLILFFDLPVESSKQRKEYRQFVKKIKSLGFYMLQKSVYVKMGIDNQSILSSINKVKPCLPKEGNIFILSITEKQFASIEILLGDERITNIVDTDERIVEIWIV